MKQFILVRHGELAPQYKVAMVGSRSDLPLSESGKENVAALASIFQRLNPEKIWCSPLLRARQTAEILTGGKDFELDSDLLEVDFGTCEGMSFFDARVLTGWGHENNLADVAFENGESGLQVRARAQRVIRRLLRAEVDTCAIVTHGAFIHVLLMELLGLQPKDGWKWLAERGSISVFNYREGVFYPSLFNLTSAMLGK